MRSRLTTLMLLIAASTPLAQAWGQAPKPRRQATFTYRETHNQFDSGEGLFDYLSFDQDHGRLYFTRDGGVEVFDARKPELAYIGNIPGAPGRLVDQAVLIEDLNLGFTSNGEGNSTTIFDLGTLHVRGTFALDEQTDAAAYDDATGHAYFFSPAGHDVIVYDLRRHATLAHIPLGSAPEFAIDDHAGSLYVNLPATGMIAKIDARTNAVVSSFPVDPTCQANTSLEIDATDHLLFAGCANGVLDVLSTRSETTVSTFPVGVFPDGIVYDASQRIAFVASVSHIVTAVAVDSPTSQSLLGNITTGPGTHTITEDDRTGKVYVGSVKFGPPYRNGTPTFYPETMHIETLAP